jgi:hypothetical protein
VQYFFILQALGFLMDVITSKKFCVDLVKQIIDCSLLKIFELAMFASDGHIARRQAVGFIRAVVNIDVFKQNVLRFVNVLTMFSACTVCVNDS